MMIANSATRVSEQTDESINEQIHRFTDTNIAYFSSHPEEIDQRLMELDQEWDIERVLETVASSASMFGLVLGILGRRRWLLLPVVVQGFFLQHAIQGWSPPLSGLRRMGFRTPAEIETERYALKAIRGDFRGVAPDEDQGGGGGGGDRADKVMRAVRGEVGGRIGSLRNVGDAENRRMMPSKNPGRKEQRGKQQGSQSRDRATDMAAGTAGEIKEPSGKTKEKDKDTDKEKEEGIPQPDVGPTS